MITMHPFQMTEKYDLYCLEFRAVKDKMFWIQNQRKIAELIEYSGVNYGVVHLNDIWLYLHPKEPVLNILVDLSSSLGACILSRVHVRTILYGINYTRDVEQIIELRARQLFNELHLQPDMFDGNEPKFDCLRGDLRTGLWIT
jgi:hypothetical protein